MTQLPDTTTEAGQREASRMLARLMPDWSVHNDWQITTPEGYGLRNLYAISEMAQAWKVLNWANNSFFGGETRLDQWHWWHDFVADMRLLPPAAAQRAWLNKILTLAIEAGMLP